MQKNTESDTNKEKVQVVQEKLAQLLHSKKVPCVKSWPGAFVRGVSRLSFDFSSYPHSPQNARERESMVCVGSVMDW